MTAYITSLTFVVLAEMGDKTQLLAMTLPVVTGGLAIIVLLIWGTVRRNNRPEKDKNEL